MNKAVLDHGRDVATHAHVSPRHREPSVPPSEGRRGLSSPKATFPGGNLPSGLLCTSSFHSRCFPKGSCADRRYILTIILVLMVAGEPRGGPERGLLPSRGDRTRLPHLPQTPRGPRPPRSLACLPRFCYRKSAAQRAPVSLLRRLRNIRQKQTNSPLLPLASLCLRWTHRRDVHPGPGRPTLGSRHPASGDWSLGNQIGRLLTSVHTSQWRRQRGWAWRSRLCAAWSARGDRRTDKAPLTQGRAASRALGRPLPQHTRKGFLSPQVGKAGAREGKVAPQGHIREHS